MSQDVRASKGNKAEKTMTIGAASTLTGVEVHTLRYWEREFSGYLIPARTPGGQRRYRPEDIQTIFTLKRLLRDEMYSLAGAKRYLKAHLKNAA